MEKTLSKSVIINNKRKGLNPLNYKRKTPIRVSKYKPHLKVGDEIDCFLDKWTRPTEIKSKFIRDNLEIKDIINKKVIKPIEKLPYKFKNKNNKYYKNYDNALKTDDININYNNYFYKENNNNLQIDDIPGTKTYIKNNDINLLNYDYMKTDDINQKNLKEIKKKKILDEAKIINKNKKANNKINMNDYFELLRKNVKKEIYANNKKNLKKLNKKRNLVKKKD